MYSQYETPNNRPDLGFEVPPVIGAEVNDAHIAKAAQVTEASTRIRTLPPGASEQLYTELELAETRLPEPSLVGITTSPELLAHEQQNIAAIYTHAEEAGEWLPPQDDAVNRLSDRIQDMDRLFHERIEPSSTLYWHFSRRGLDILHDRELRSAHNGAQSNTGAHSEGIHFVKPGTGFETDSHYYLYALGMGQHTPDESTPFGVAVIYRLGDIITTTPRRDEPAEAKYRGRAMAQDATFRTEDESADYAYPLDTAYLLPFASTEQLAALKINPAFAHYFETPKTAAEIAYVIATDAARDAGYDEDWIRAHILNTAELVDPAILEQVVPYPAHKSNFTYIEGSEQQLYSVVGGAIHERLEPDIELVIPLSAERGSYEMHDVDYGLAQQVERWREKLARIPVQSKYKTSLNREVLSIVTSRSVANLKLLCPYFQLFESSCVIHDTCVDRVLVFANHYLSRYSNLRAL